MSRKGNYGHPQSEETKNKLRLLNTGKRFSQEYKAKMSEKLKGRVFSAEHRANLKKPKTIEQKRKMSETRKKLWGSKEYRDGLINIMTSKPYRDKVSKSMQAVWHTVEHQEKMSKAFSLKPTKPELELQEILNDLFPNEYKYVGNFQVWFGNRNPDFINVNGKKKLIELFGHYWHKNSDGKKRIKHFKKYGFDTLVIWESEIKNEGVLRKKLIEFQGG